MEIPLFPLPNLVLFPNVIVPLHIFEDRYKLMINSCIDLNEAFGLVLLRGSGEVESSEMIHRVGVAARIIEVERVEEGRMNILCQGESRFRIHRFIQERPYWKGAVDFFDDDDATFPFSELSDRVAGLYKQVFELGTSLNLAQSSDMVIPESPADLSFMLSYVLDIDPAEKQTLLEMTSTSERLQALVTYLDQTLQKLQQQIEYKKVLGKARGNGDLGKPHA